MWIKEKESFFFFYLRMVFWLNVVFNLLTEEVFCVYLPLGRILDLGSVIARHVAIAIAQKKRVHRGELFFNLSIIFFYLFLDFDF
jgi:hypothetical protein